MACNRQRSEEIADFAAGRLEGHAVDELLEHLDACEPCSLELDLAADLARLGGRAEQAGLAEQSESIEPPSPRRRSASSPPAAPRRPGSRPRAWLRAVLPLAAAAGLLFVFLARTPSPTLESLAELEPLPYPTSVLRGDDDGARRAAMEHYQAGDFEQAAAALDALAARDPSDALAHFYRGVSLLQLGRTAEARSPLVRAIDGSDGLLRERALWYLAGTELALGQAEGARGILERLIELDGEYALDARAKLDALRPFLAEGVERE